MTLADVDIATGSEGEVERLPEKPLSVGFIPIAPFSPHTEGYEELALGTEFHHGGAIRVADPDVVLCVDCHAVRLVLVADHVIADCAEKLVIRAKLKQLWFPDGIALKDPQVSFRIDRDRRDTAAALGQINGIGVGETHRLFPL